MNVHMLCERDIMGKYTAEELEQLHIDIFGESDMAEKELEQSLRQEASFDPHAPFEKLSLYESAPLRYSNRADA